MSKYWGKWGDSFVPQIVYSTYFDPIEILYVKGIKIINIPSEIAIIYKKYQKSTDENNRLNIKQLTN